MAAPSGRYKYTASLLIDDDELRRLRILVATQNHPSISAYMTSLVRRELAKAEKKKAA